MARWSHSMPDVRRALAYADVAGFKVVATPDAHRRDWGYINCWKCDQRLHVNSTPKNASNHAKRIREFIRRHHHQDD